MLKLDPPPKVITFDCYGTLVQWHRAVRQAGRAILSEHLQTDAPQNRVAVLAAQLREVAVEHQQRPPFREYDATLHTSLSQVLAEAGHRATTTD